MEHPHREVIAELDYDNLLPFLRPQLCLNLIWGVMYWMVNLIPLGSIIYYWWVQHISLDTFLTNVGLGFWMFFVLLPVHELLHAAVYKIVGAPKVSFGGSWKKFIFYAVADRFMVDRKKFLFVALAPFFIINTGLVILFFTYSYPVNLIFLAAIILHTAGCFGDFALVSFMHRHRHQNIVTMDEVAEKKTYFFTVPDKSI